MATKHIHIHIGKKKTKDADEARLQTAIRNLESHCKQAESFCHKGMFSEIKTKNISSMKALVQTIDSELSKLKDWG